MNSTSEADRQTAAPHAINLTPVVSAITKAGQSLGEAATGILAQAGKQWSALIADAQAERKASETGAAAEVVQDQAATSRPAQPQAPVMVPAPAATTTAAPAAPPVEPVTAAATVEATASAPAGPTSSAAADDLEQIRGIGPKVAALLRDAGITTFDQLAAADVEQLRAILLNAGTRYRVTDPTPWPAEARQLLEARGN